VLLPCLWHVQCQQQLRAGSTQQLTAGSPPAAEHCSAAGGELRKLIPLPKRAQRAF